MGAVMGANVRDICDLVGGMQEGDRLEIIARDGFKKEFAYKNVYEYDEDREGPMVLCWYKDGMYPESGYNEGMRLVWFAAPTYKEGPTSIEELPSGDYHVFGNWDWHEAADPKYWYYYQGEYPTTTGLSVQNVSKINIYELAAPPVLTAANESNEIGQPVDIIFADDAAWRNAIIGITVNGKALTNNQFSVTEGNINLAAEIFTAAGEYDIVVQAIGYSNATVKQKMEVPEIPLTIVVKENGVETRSVDYNLGEWTELKRQHYSIRDSMPAYRLGAAEGVYLEDILNEAEINIESIEGFKFISTDDYSTTLSKSELFDGQRYYYPNIFSENKEEGAQVVKPMLALKSCVGERNDSTLPSWDSIDDKDAIRLFIGQKNVEDINYGLYAKLICEIEVELAEPSQPVAVADVRSPKVTRTGSRKDGQLIAVVEDATNKNVTWSSDDETVATVSATGLVTAVAEGTATITVTTEDGNKTAAITVTVVEPTIPSDWTLQLSGARDETITKSYFEQGLACSPSHHAIWTDDEGNVWGGMPLWLLVGMVDDNPDVGDYHIGFNYELAMQGYDIKVIGGDNYSATLDSASIARNDGYIVANTLNGEPLPLKTESGKNCWPLYLKGSAVSGKQQVGNIVRIELSGLPEEPDHSLTQLRIVKYGEDNVTIIDEVTLTYQDMEEQLEVIGDGATVYKFQGVTFDPDDPWDEDGSQLDDFKIANAVKGTRISDLCSLVGGMGAGTEIVLVATDGWETKLPYSSIYPDPSVQERQGDAILAWYADGNYVPDYKDGMRLFFTPEDTIYSQMDMRETLPEAYWHYYGADGIMYPSCAGLSAKYVTMLKVYTVPQGDWTLELDGGDIGGLKVDVSKTYFESALTCTMGANHKASYTDSKNRTWEGMPLWLLVGFVDDADQHSNNAFNRDLALSGYQVVITARDGAEVIIDSRDIDRNHDYIVANSLDGNPIPEDDKSWPLRLVGPKASGSTSISQIVSIKLVRSESGEPAAYTVAPVADPAYTIGATPDGISSMTVNSGISGFKYFTAQISPQVEHSGLETVVFTHLRNGSQLQINSTKADFDVVDTAQAGFNVHAGDVVKVFIVDELTNATDHNPVILQ